MALCASRERISSDKEELKQAAHFHNTIELSKYLDNKKGAGDQTGTQANEQLNTLLVNCTFHYIMCTSQN